MNPQHIAVVTVSYNTPALLHGLLTSLRRFYKNPVFVIDGSDAEHQPQVAAVVAAFDGVRLHTMGYNIHHGPGLGCAEPGLEWAGAVFGHRHRGLARRIFRVTVGRAAQR
jgi:hypothetical protein